MGMITINRNPTRREVRVFGALWLVFFAALAGMVLWRPAGLLGAAAFLGAMWLISLIFNAEDRSSQRAGLLLPLLFLAAGGLVRSGVADTSVALGLGSIGMAGALAAWLAPAVGRTLYVIWMLAAAPIGWTISHLVLGVVYYLVLTPIGLVLRIAGHDPMKRRFDRGAASYWVERRPGDDPARYFRQF